MLPPPQFLHLSSIVTTTVSPTKHSLRLKHSLQFLQQNTHYACLYFACARCSSRRNTLAYPKNMLTNHVLKGPQSLRNLQYWLGQRVQLPNLLQIKLHYKTLTTRHLKNLQSKLSQRVQLPNLLQIKLHYKALTTRHLRTSGPDWASVCSFRTFPDLLQLNKQSFVTRHSPHAT
jgi:hypothetical protein